MCTKYTAYLRVSTDRQGKSGLGLEAQQAAVEAFVAGRSADARLLQSFTEVEIGKHADRPELARAMEHARLTGSTLLIAKLDRLSRDAHFLIGLQKSGVAFTACDMPYADQFTVGIMALVAQKEREMISERTKAALAAARRAASSSATQEALLIFAGLAVPLALPRSSARQLNGPRACGRQSMRSGSRAW
jgi:DNA invertase Pin-like site-specific DNA recombinase